MCPVNVNKFFPRLPIRVKLAIAFAALATIPLAITGALGTRITLSYIDSSARAGLDHELKSAAERTEHFLAAVQEDVSYLAGGVFAPVLRRRSRPGVSLDSLVRAFLRAKPAFIQVKLFDAEGELILLARAVRSVTDEEKESAGGAYYIYRAQSLRAGERLLLPVEIRSWTEGAVAAIAVLHPIRDAAGELAGVAVGEAYASMLFTALESGSPQFAETTGLVGADGRFLYHSERKSDWSSLLATSPDAHLLSEFDEDVARQIVAGEAGTVTTESGRLVSYMPLRIQSPGEDTGLFLYRSIPISAIQQPARRFLWGVGTGGVVVLALALVLAVAAATQFTNPIYQLREGARRLADGEFRHELAVETNDELEDLAVDFADMAERLREHTQGLEDLVASRTADLREAHTELQEILTSSEDAIIRLEVDDRVRVWNKGAEKLFGYKAAEAIGRDVNELLLPPNGEGRRQAARIERELRRRGSLVDYHTTRVRKDGRCLVVSLSQTVIRSAAGEPLGSTLIIRDVTQQTELEKQIVRSERLAAAGRLAAGIAHEISNPIGIILNRLELMDLESTEGGSDHQDRDDLRVIRDQTERVGEVARRLLSIARDEPQEPQPVDLNDLLVRTVKFLEPTLAKRGLEIEWDLAPNLPVILASPQGLEIVVLNLLLNALDASSEGGRISAATRVAADYGSVELVVTDFGSGIPPELIEHIFEAFFTTKSQPKGTGLGLAITRNIVQTHGGDVSVESELGAGSRFTVTLPVQPKRAKWKQDAFS